MTSSKLCVAAIQLSSGEDVQQNLEACAHWVRDAARRGARIVVLPEGFAYLGPERAKKNHAEVIGDFGAPIQSALAALALETSTTLIAGGLPEVSAEPERPYNTCLVVGPAGDLLGAYRKVHLFDVELPDGTAVKESQATSAGSAPVVVEAEGVHVGLSICYDVRFPELYRALVAGGAEVLVVPAAFTLQTGKDHWKVLLRARAIESQCWVVAAGQWGPRPKGPPSYGHSMIVDPWGTVVAQVSDGTGTAVAELDRAYQERVRKILPSLAHRRL
jgi:deaminated glutathione amidase